MDNVSNANQHMIVPNDYYGGYSGAVSSKSRPKWMFVVGAIVGVFFCLMIVLLIVSNNSQQGIHLAKENTPTLRLFGVLSNGTPINELEEIARGIEEDFEVTIDYQEDAGMIRLGDAEDYIVFTFYREVVDDTTNDTAQDEGFENNDFESDNVDGEDIDNTEEMLLHIPYAAYDISYILGGGMEDVLSYNETERLYEYYDGEDVFQFETKQEAIEGYLAS